MKRGLFVLFVLAMLSLGSLVWGQNNALFFDGVNDCVAIGNMQSQITTTYTVEAWINTKTVAVGSGELATYGRTIIASSSGNGKPLWVSLRGNQILVRSFNGNNAQITYTIAGMTIDTWYHIAVSATRSGTVRLYVNGLPVASASAGTQFVWNNTMCIGDLRPGRQVAFWGSIDDVRVWNDIRSDAEILANFDVPLSAPFDANLVGYWMLDESAGTTAYDSVNNFDGTLRNGTSVQPTPQWVDGNPTLPIELSSFSATITSQYFVQLHWITQSETDVMGYIVLRNNHNDLTTALQVSPLVEATNTTTQVSYSYTDSEVTPGIWYYWLQSIDLNGDHQYHGPVMATVSEDSGSSAPQPAVINGINKLYPNPFNPSLNISFSLDKTADVSFKIYNSRGQMVHSNVLGNRDAGTYNFVWNSGDLPTGFYLIRMQANNKVYTQKATLSK
ncbi:MAG TPA: T9SS type A sorting domain-containing protein [Candidatus Cloacimonadota bacterium]|nr:T9SS type A sorting domain-containing protein [Candidatus Cloacimonadota bacterium]